MIIHNYTWDSVDSNSWLIIEENQGLLIDAVDNNALFSSVARLQRVAIILTHSHFDHIIGLNKIRKTQSDISVIATDRCSERIGDIHRNMSSTIGTFLLFYDKKKRNRKIEPFTCEAADIVFNEKLSMKWMSHTIDLYSVYGHTCDGLVAIMDNEFLFSGDTLLNIPTTTRFPTGSKKRFWEEDIPMLEKMNMIERVYPGHGQPGRIEDMIMLNRRIIMNKEKHGE